MEGVFLNNNTNSKSGSWLNVEKALLRFPLILLIITSMIISVNAANYEADSSQIEWVEPFSPTTGNQPAHFQSGSDVPVGVKVKEPVDSSSGQVSFQLKDASGTSFSEIYSVDIDDRFHHGSPGSDADYDPNVYLLHEENSITVQEGNSETVTVDGAEHVFEPFSVDPSNDPPLAGTYVDGDAQDLNLGDYNSVPNEPCTYIRVTDVYSDVNDDNFVEYTFYNKCFSDDDGGYDLKAVAEVNQDEFYHSEPIYFNFELADGLNTPYVDALSYDGKELSSLNSNSEVSVGDTLVATVVKQEADPYNVTLVDRASGQQLTTAEVNSDGILQNFRDALLDVSLGLFIDVSGFQSGDVAEVPLKLTPEQNDEVDFLNTVNGSYQLGLEIEDPQGIRRTVDYSLQTDQSAAAPVVESIEASNDCSSYQPITSFDGESNPVDCIKVTATDSDTDASQLGVSLNLTHVYDNITYYETSSYSNYDSRNGNEYIFDTSNAENYLGEFRESGGWTAKAQAEDGLNSDSLTRQWEIPWGDLAVEMVTPSSDITVKNNETFAFDLRITCGGGPECVNQNESVTLYFDPLKQASNSFLENLKARINQVLN